MTAEVGIGKQGGASASRSTSTSSCPTLERRRPQLVEQAHEVCPYCNATRGNIDVELVIE